MIRRVARPFAFGGLLAAVVGAFGGIALRLVDPVPIVGSFGFGDTALVGMSFLGMTFASVGALLVVRRPENAVGWCMVLIGAGYALGMLAASMTFSAVADGPTGAGTARIMAWLTVLFTTIGGLVFALGFIFPTGRGHTPAWDRFVRLGAVASPLMLIVLFLVRPGPLHLFATIDNPFGVGPDLRPIFGPQVSETIAASVGVVVPFLAVSIASRYRMSDTVGRQQLKWFVLSLLVALGGVAAATMGAFITREPPVVGLALFGFAGALVPIAIGIAILRHGLYDIDRIISRTLGYAVVTGVLVLVFAGIVLLLGGLLTLVAQGLIPSSQGRSVAVAISTLVVFALFQPVRRRVQAAVDRRYDRARYDADQTVRAFSGRLRNDVDLAAVRQEIVDTATAVVRPTSVTVWLRGAGR